LPARQQIVETHRISDTDNVTGRLVGEPQRDVKIQLLTRALALMPFSICRLPAGTTTLEFVTSGRSVAISSLVPGQVSALAEILL
jgi:hypothetical protein